MKHKLDFISKKLSEIYKASLYRKLVESKVNGSYIIIKGKSLLNLSSNDYLGLGYTKLKYNQLQSSSRLISGNDISFNVLEKRLARHKSKERSLVFPTGYMANLGIISTLTQKNDLVLSDELNHASIIDSCRLSYSKKEVYKHNNLEDLEKKLRKNAVNKFVITEGVFSMNGDFSNLREIFKLCQKYDAFLLLDDAHGDFVVGKDGKGTAHHQDVAQKVDVYTSSLSKGLGAFGGYVASSDKIIKLMINTSRPFIYTSALPNILVEMTLDKFHTNREKKRVKLWKNIKQFRDSLVSLGYQVDSRTHIIPIIIGDEKATLEFGRYLFKNGIFAQPIRYPTVEKGSARIRVSITAWLSNNQITEAMNIFEKAGKKFKIT